MECHRQLGCTEEELRTRLSKHLDGETRGSEARAIEEHLKECARCRDDLASLRGVDHRVAHAVAGTRASTGFIARAMAAIGGRPPDGRPGGRAVPRLLIWVIIAVALPGVCALVVLLVHAITAQPPPPLRELDLCVADGPAVSEGASAPRWRMRGIGGKEKWTELASGAKLAARTEVTLEPTGGHGVLSRKDGLAIYAAAGATILIDKEATAEQGISLDAGRVLIVRPEGAGRFRLGLPGASSLAAEGAASRARVAVEDAATSVTVLAGAAVLGGPWGTRRLERRDSAEVAPGGLPRVARRADLRSFRLEFAPPESRPSPWPGVGGSPAREGNSPFALSLPPRKVLELKDTSGASAPVIGPDGTLYFLAGAAPGRLVGVKRAPEGQVPPGGSGRTWKVVMSVPLEDPFVGDPAMAPDGSVVVATRGGLVRCRPGREGFESIARLEADDIPRTGPMVVRDGHIYLVTGKCLAGYGPGGRQLWRRLDIRSSSPPSAGPGGEVLVASISGKLHALDPKTGEDRPGATTPVDEPFLTHVAVARDGTAYAVSSSRYLVWRAPGGESGRVALPAAEYVLAPAIAPSGEIIVASSAGAIYRLRPRSTEPPEALFFDTGEAIRRGPLVGGAGTLVVWTASGRLVAVETSGRPHTWDIGARESSAAAVSWDGGLYFVTRDGRVFGR